MTMMIDRRVSYRLPCCERRIRPQLFRVQVRHLHMKWPFVLSILTSCGETGRGRCHMADDASATQRTAETIRHGPRMWKTDSTHNGPAISPHLQYSTDETGCKTYVELSNAHDMPRPPMTTWHDTTVLGGAPEAGQIPERKGDSPITTSSSQLRSEAEGGTPRDMGKMTAFQHMPRQQAASW